MAKPKKELTQQQQKARTIINWVMTAICIVIIVFALVVAIFTISSTTNDKHLMQFGDKIYMNVASDSMEPTFSASDILIADAFDKDTDMDRIKVGQVISFSTTARKSGSTYEIFNTHRIVKINYADEANTIITSVVTRGDNQDLSWKEAIEQENLGKVEAVDIDSIVATWGDGEEDGKMLKGVGGFSNWIQDTENFGESQKVRFFCVVVLPLILLFVVYAVVLIRTLVIAKLENQRKVQAEQVITVDSLSEEEKQRLAQEYLASLQQNDNPDVDAVEDECALSDDTQAEEVVEQVEDTHVEEENVEQADDSREDEERAEQVLDTTASETSVVDEHTDDVLDKE